MIVDNFAACCCFQYVAASIVMSFNIMTKHCFVKRIKTEEKCMLKNTQFNNRLFHLDTAKCVIELILAKIKVCLNAID